MAAVVQMSAGQILPMNVELDNILRQIHASYTPEMRKDVVNFTKENLQGEYKGFKSGEDLPDVLNTMKKQGQIGPSNTEQLKYYVKNASKENRKMLLKKVHDFKLKYQNTDNRDFVGRQTDVDVVLSSIEDSKSNVINVFGEKGVGKTTFAGKVSEKLALPEQIHSVDLQQARDVNTIISSILLVFNNPKAIIPSKEVVYEMIENLEKHSVIILDNFVLNQSKDLELELNEFITFLKDATEHDKGNNLTIMITSHSVLTVDFIKDHRLEALSSDNSAELLKEVCADESTKDQIGHLCKNSPLHLQTTVAVLREKLTEPQEVLDKCQSKSQQDISNVLTQAFEVFSPNMKKVAITLSMFQSPFTINLAAMLLKCSSSEANLYLGSLKFRHFLSLVNKKYSMHSLAKEVLAKKGKEKNHVDTYNEAQETFSRLFVKRAKEISDLSDKDYIKMYLQIQKEKHNINFALKISFERGFLLTSSEFRDNFHVSVIAKCLQIGHERAELFRDLSAAALSRGEVVSYIHFSSQLILVLLEKTSTKTEAREVLKEIGETLQEAPIDSSTAYLLAESSYEFAKGEIAYNDFHNKICSREQFDEGMACHKKCLQTRKELLGDHTETTRSLNAVGNCFMELEEHEIALHYFTQAIEMRKRLSGDKEHIDSPTFMNQVATVHEEMGKKFKSQSRKSKMPEKKELFFQAQREFQQEVDKFQEALDMEKRLHIYGNIRTATFYRNLSNAYSYLEQYKEAYIYAKKALRIRKKLLGIDVDTVRSYYQIGVAYEWLDKSKKALKYYYKAYNMENKLPPGERSRVKLKIEGKIQSLLGDIEEAVEYDSRTDEEVMTSDDEDDDKKTVEEEVYYSDESSSGFGSSDEEETEPEFDVLSRPSKEPPKPTLTPSEPLERDETLLTSGEEDTLSEVPFAISSHALLPLNAFDDEEEIDSEEVECEDVEESKLIGSNECVWKIKDSGILLYFEPNTLESDIMVKCLLRSPILNPLDPGETLVSRVVHLEAKKMSVNKSFTEVIPHSGPTRAKGYEVIVKEFCEETNSWRDVDGDLYTNVQNEKELPMDNILSSAKNMKFPSICLKRQSVGIVCVVSRLVSDTMSVESSRRTLTSSVFPDICVELQEDTFKGYAEVSLKVHPLPTRLFKSTKVCCGPVIELSMSDAPSDDILKPVKVKLPQPLVFHRDEPQPGDLRILYNERDDGHGEWKDITDNIILDVHGNVVEMKINHFSLFLPVWLKDSKNAENVVPNVKRLLSKVFGKSPMSAFFSVSLDCRVGYKATLKVSVKPSHMDGKSNSLEDLYDKEKVTVKLIGGVKRFEHETDRLNNPFTISFDHQCERERGLHVLVQENRCTCQFKGFERSEVFCEVPFLLPDIEELTPKDFFGIPLEDDILSQTAIEDVVSNCRKVLSQMTSQKELRDILDKTTEERFESKAIQYFYQKIAHKVYEEQVFDAVVSAQAKFDGGLHVKELLEKGRAMVEKPIDEGTIRAISPMVVEFCQDIAMALDLTEKYEKNRWNLSEEKQFQEIMKAWRNRSGSSANLHSLMKVMLKINCERGRDELLRRYKEILSGKVSQAHEAITFHEVYTQSTSTTSNFAGKLEGLSHTPNEQSTSEENYSYPSITSNTDDSNDSSLFYYSVCLFVAAAGFLLYRYIRK